jgi:hypothetical protein
MAAKQKKRREIHADQRWGSDTDLCRHLGITMMTLWRWRNDPELDFPKAVRVRGRPRNNFALVDAYLLKLAKKRAA